MPTAESWLQAITTGLWGQERDPEQRPCEGAIRPEHADVTLSQLLQADPGLDVDSADSAAGGPDLGAVGGDACPGSAEQTDSLAGADLGAGIPAEVNLRGNMPHSLGLGAS